MKRILFGALIACMVAGVVIARQNTTETQHRAPAGQEAVVDLDLDQYTLVKKCSFASDCSHGKCKSGKCGSCSFNSDCNGWGKCKNGQCGSCSFSSDCKGFGSCSSSRCSKSPY